MTRILFVHHATARAGAFISLLGLLEGLDRSRFECIVCSSDSDQEVEELLGARGYRTCASHLPMFGHTSACGWFHPWRIDTAMEFGRWLTQYPQARKRFADLLAKIAPDIVHLNSLTLAPYAGVARKMGVPVVVHVRERVARGFVGARRAWLRSHIDTNANKVICICRDNLESLGLRHCDASVVYNPVDFHCFDSQLNKEQARRAIGVPIDAKAVLFAGGSVPTAKGLYDFLEAMIGLAHDTPRLFCLMPGVVKSRDLAPQSAGVRGFAAGLLGLRQRRSACLKSLASSDLLTRTAICDFTYEMHDWLAACDVVCVPHIDPHFSRTVMEAGAMRKPVVAYAVGGIEEVVTHGETGLMVKRKDVNGMRGMVKQLLDCPELCDRLGDGGYRQARRLCDSQDYARRIEVIYSGLTAAVDKEDPADGVG